MKKLAIFDLDGTLVNTIEDLGHSSNYALAECGYPIHNMASYPFMVGNGVKNLLLRSVPEEARNESSIARVLKIFKEYYNEHNCDRTVPYEGLPELLESLVAMGVKVAVASNKYQEAAQQLVDHFFPNIFHFVYGKREGLAAKPDPMVVRHCIIQALKAYRHIDQVALFGDSYIDIQTAHNANITAVGCTWGYGEESKLLAAKPHHILHSPQQIYNLCCEL